MYRFITMRSVARIVAIALALWNRPAAAGSVIGSFTPIATGSNVDLTIQGKLDWVHWGLHTDTSINRKAGVPPLISDFSVLGPGTVFTFQYTDNYNTYSWHDGTPAASVTNTPTGVWTYQAYPPTLLGSGFQFTAPADTNARILQVYVGTFAARGRLEASLTDGGLPYTDNSLFNEVNGPGGVYTLNYQANSPGQALTVKWTLSQRAAGSNSISGNVTLQAAALTASQANNPPLVTFLSPTNQTTFTFPANLPLTVAAEDFDGTVTNVAIYEDTNLLTQLNAAPYTFEWNNPPLGDHKLRALAYDNQGSSRWSVPVEAVIFGTGGLLSGSVAPAPPTADLTALGSADWIHWGLVTNTSIDRKNGSAIPIPNYLRLGTNAAFRYADNYTSFSWSDGTPTPITNGTPTGIFVTGFENGFELRLPAITSNRTARLYLGGYGMQANLEAFLGDFSAPPYIDNSVSNLYDNVAVIYTLSYAAATPGQELVVRYRIADPFDFDFGNVTLPAIALEGEVTTLTPVHLTAFLNGSSLDLSFNTQTNHSYTVQSTESLNPPAWSNLTEVVGTGNTITIADQISATAKRFYRVQVQ